MMNNSDSSLAPFDLDGRQVRVIPDERGEPGLIGAIPAHQQDRVSALLLIGQAVARVPGVKPGIVMAATLTCIERNTGLATDTLRRALPAVEGSIRSLNSDQRTSRCDATGLGQLLGMKAKDTSQHLAACRLQVRNGRGEWELTDAGQRWVSPALLPPGPQRLPDPLETVG